MKIKSYQKLIKKLLDSSMPFYYSLTKLLETIQQQKEISKLACSIEKNNSSLNTFRILILIDRIINEQ